ncbi:MAG: DUF362 domain-containing protein [Desulfovibrionales bacterium]
MNTAAVPFTTFDQSVRAALDRIRAQEVLALEERILIKPNLVNDSPPPVTTPVSCCDALVRYIHSCSSASIVIAEGCGDVCRETEEIFRIHGYDLLAREHGLELIDLNSAPLRRLENPACPVFPEMHLPELLFTHFLISVPVLKAHSLAEITGSLKNMIGTAPPSHYSSSHGTWKKAAFHGRMQQSIIDLNRYRSPDLSLMDASVGLAQHHLGGRTCAPPLSRIIAGWDPWDVDRRGADLLGLEWQQIAHLADRPVTL